MTDTARTLAEIQALLPDQNTGDISPQDVRDAVQSIATPIPGGGFQGTSILQATPFRVAAPAGGLELVAASSPAYGNVEVAAWGANLPGGSLEVQRGRSLVDPTYSLSGLDPTSTYGVDVDAGNAFMLEPGVWDVNTYWTVAAGDVFIDPGQIPVMAYFDQTEYDPDFSGAVDGTAPYYYDGWYNPNTANPWYPILRGDLGTNAVWGQYQNFRHVNDTDEAKPFAMFLYTLPGWETNVTVVNYGVYFYKER